MYLLVSKSGKKVVGQTTEIYKAVVLELLAGGNICIFGLSVPSCCGCICGALGVQITLIALGKGVNVIDNGKQIWVMLFCNGDMTNIPRSIYRAL